MASKKKKPLSLLEELRAIRDRLSLKLLSMTPEEQIAYLNQHGAWFEKARAAKKPITPKRAKPVAKRRRPATKQRA